MTTTLSMVPGGEALALIDAADARKQRLDRLLRVACRVLAAPIALLAVAEPSGDTVAASVGLLTAEIADALSFGEAAQAASAALVVPDAAADPRFAASPLVTGGPCVRFFAGQRLNGPGGEPLGALCLFDRRRRELDAADLEALADLAATVQVEIHAVALQRAFVQQSEGLAQARAIIDLTADGVLLCDEGGAILACNGAAAQMFGYELAELIGARLDFLVPALRREAAAGAAAPDSAALSLLAAEPRETIARRRSGEAIIVRLGVRALSGEAGGRWLALVHDAAGGHRGEAQRRRRLPAGTLRELPDRAFFRSRLAQAFAAEAGSGGSTAVLLLELDYFDKAVEKLGRQAADALLLEVYRRLRTCLRPDDTAAFMGGGAFAVLFEGLGATRDAQRPAERILGQLRTPLASGRSELIAAPNIGIALSSLCLGAAGSPDLIREADEALRQARAAGRWRLQIFSAHEHASGGATQLKTPAIAALPAPAPAAVDGDEAVATAKADVEDASAA